MLGRAMLVLAVVLTALGGSAAEAGRRVALVIGNADYQAVGRLTNPANDAAAIASALQAAGFDEVRLVGDLGQREMLRALRDFTAIVAGSETAVIYYAGHGVEVAGRNYLIPTDASLTQATDVEFEAVLLDNVRAAVAGASKLRVVVLDACRNNPFKLASASGTRSIGRGLAAIEPGANELIAYAAKEGTLASDGTGGNSPYAAALVKHLGEPNLDVRLLFGRVRDEVLAATSGQQEPFIYGTLGGSNLPLAASSVPVAAEPVPPIAPVAASTSAAPADDEAARLWPAVETTQSCGVLQSFVDRFAASGSVFVDFARARRLELGCEAASATAPPAAETETVLQIPPTRVDPPAAAAETLTLTPGVLTLGKWAEGIAFDGTTIWIAESGDRSIMAIAPDGGISRVKVGRLPVGMASRPDGTIYALVQTDKIVWQQGPNGAKGRKLATLKECPQAIAANDNAVWVVTMPDCSSATSRAIRIAPGNGRQTPTDELGEWAQTLVTGHGKVWVGHARGTALSVIDPASMAVAKADVAGVSVWAMASTPSRLYVGGRIGEDNTQGVVAMIDPASQQEVGRVALGERIAVLAADERHVAAIGEAGTVFILDAADLTVVRTVALDVGPFQPSSALMGGDKILLVAQQLNGENGALLVVKGWR